MRHERRKTARWPACLQVKVQPAGDAPRFVAARTHDLSTGGAMLEIRGEWQPCAGDRVQIGIATRPHQGLLTASEFAEATVTRSLRHDGRPFVAVHFTTPRAAVLSA